MTLASFLFTVEMIFTVATPKNPQNDLQNASAATKKKERRSDKTPAHKINVQSLAASVGEPQTVASDEVKINEAVT